MILVKLMAYHRMNHFFKLFLGTAVGSILIVGRASVALAHEGELHLTEGFALTPLTIGIFGGTLAGILLAAFLLRSWAVRSLKRKDEQKQLQSASHQAMARENNDTGEER